MSVNKSSKNNTEPVSIFKRRKKSIFNNDSSISKSNTSRNQVSQVKDTSILPSDSYLNQVGITTSKMSPEIKPRMKVHSKIMDESDFFDVNGRKGELRKKRTGRRQKTKTINEENPKPETLRSQLQSKYKEENIMSHTPNPKSKNIFDNTVYTKRSQTPEPKPKPKLIPDSTLYLKESLKNKKYTLVLDLDETLIHFKNDKGKAKFLIRPHTYKFLRNLEPYYELIIFTAAQQEYADWIINKIDTKVIFINYLLIYRNWFLIGFIDSIVS